MSTPQTSWSGPAWTGTAPDNRRSGARSAWVFMYSLDGLLADEGTDYWQYCFGLPIDPEDQKQKLDLYESAYARIMGRTAYEGMAEALPTAGHPLSGIMNAARKVVFSRTLNTDEWANTTITTGDTTEEIDKLRRGGDGHIVVWGGVGLRRWLMRLDLIDELRLDLHPYVAGEGTRLFDDVPKSYLLALVSSTASSNGTVGLQYRGTASCPVSPTRPRSPVRGRT
jgi:dihydrofolate reductase